MTVLTGRAEQLVAAVRDDPDARIRLAASTFGTARRYRPYRKAVVAFMGWQRSRGVLNAVGGSAWWRAVNEDLLRDAAEAKLLVDNGLAASSPSVAHWVAFFTTPSARSFYLAHNSSVVAGYLAHREVAAAEAPAERFFMNVVLVRVLYAHALVLDGDLALGRLAFVAGVIGHPRARGPQALLAMKDVLPQEYPVAETDITRLIGSENRLGRLFDYGVISTRMHALYESSARALDVPTLVDLVRDDGTPSYVWPAEQRGVWTAGPRRKLDTFIAALTRPRLSPVT